MRKKVNMIAPRVILIWTWSQTHHNYFNQWINMAWRKMFWILIAFLKGISHLSKVSFAWVSWTLAYLIWKWISIQMDNEWQWIGDGKERSSLYGRKFDHAFHFVQFFVVMVNMGILSVKRLKSVYCGFGPSV